MSTKKTDQTLQKCDELINRLQELKKALNRSSSLKPVSALGPGWAQDPATGVLHHGAHGIVSTSRLPNGTLEIRHDGDVIAHAGNMTQAGTHIRGIVEALNSGTELRKSNYGPKGSGLYDPTANINRKARNITESVGAGPNTNVKSYSSRPGQLSAKQQAARDAKKTKKLSGPVKQYTPVEIAALNEARKMKKAFENAPWVTHGSVPNADEEVEQLQLNNPAVAGEDLAATQLAAMMQSRAMMRPDHRQPTSEDMIMAGERMGIAPTEEMIKSSEMQWGGAINDWLSEAVKPISSRFSSPEEEEKYWNSIKVSERGGGNDYGF
jgi:hypothetical protein